MGFLAVDIGNTSIVFGLFRGKRIVGRLRLRSKLGETAFWYSKRLGKFRAKVKAAAISSVVPGLNAAVKNAIKGAFGCTPVVVNWRMIKGLKIKLKAKNQVGVDRLVNAAAAYRLYGGKLVIIDFGTATTFCAVDRERYLGGAITSGLEISKVVLHERTAKLPLITIKRPGRAIGKDTVSAMRSGLFYGYIDLVEGMIKRFKRELGGRVKVIATGGLSGIIAKGTRMIDIVDQDLTLKGLKYIYDDASKDARG